MSSNRSKGACETIHYLVKKMAITLDIYTKKPEVLIKYLGCLNRHLWRQVRLFKPMKINKECVQEKYMENVGMTKGQPSGSKNKGNEDASNEKKKWK